MENALESTNATTPEVTTRQCTSRPIHKLTVNLINTYKIINQLYYADKSRRRINQGKPAWADRNHDYIIEPGEEIIERYVVRGRIGKGSFGQVLRAFDKVTKTDVALKMIKCKKPFKNQANTEIDILVELQQHADRHHVVKLLDHFEHRGHPCLIFEILSYNLYELLKNTKFRGVSLDLIHKFGKQILESLVCMGEHKIIHCDLKPENILLQQPKRSAIKVIDFGSSCKRDKKMYSYIQSRFYRSPEIIIGYPYGHGIDIWSLGCILVEMHTGDPLFGGADSHDQLFKITQLCGAIPDSLIRRAEKREKFFTQRENAAQGTYDLKLPQQYAHSDKGGFLELPKPRTLRTIVGVETGGPSGRRAGEKGHSVEHYEAFVDLVQGMLKIDPEERVEPEDALKSPFLGEELWPRPRKSHPAAGEGGGSRRADAREAGDLRRSQGSRESRGHVVSRSSSGK